MSKQLLANTFDTKTIAAVDFLAEKEADAVLALWFRMLALAVHDPDGCVRPAPGLQMDTAALAAYFRCPADTVELTLRVLEQTRQLTRDDTGNLQVPACAGAQRRGKTKKSSDSGLFPTEKETEKEKRKEAKEKSKEKNKKGDIADAISNCAPAPATRKTKNRLIPLAELPEAARNFLQTWNELPLDNKFEGLYPNVLKQLQALLERYGEETLRKAVANVADSEFLLGRSRNNRGWTVSLGWMLNPEHLENILQGKYQDKKPRNQSALFQPGDEEVPYGNGFYGTVVD